MYFEIEKQAIDAINKALDQYDEEIDRNFKLEFPPNPELGDLASTIAFALTKKLRTSPPEVAKDLVEKIEVPEIFTKVQNFGPYVNFFIDYDKFSKLLLEKVDENYGQLPEYGEKIVLEHTSANPNGPLHIGHIRNSIFGDSLARLLKLAGRDVVTQYYVNDMGRQIAIIVCGITECGLNIDDYEGDKIDHKIGKLYFDANKAVEEDDALNAKVDELIQKYEEGEDEGLNKVFEDVVSKCISGMKESLSRMNITHDDFVWEGQFVRSGEVDDVVNFDLCTDVDATGGLVEDEDVGIGIDPLADNNLLLVTAGKLGSDFVQRGCLDPQRFHIAFAGCLDLFLVQEGTFAEALHVSQDQVGPNTQ